MMLGKDDIERVVAADPTLKDALRRLASKAARAIDIPASFSTPCSYAGQRELERLLGAQGRRSAQGRVTFRIPAAFREWSAWKEAIAALGVSSEKKTDRHAVAERAKLLAPRIASIIEALAAKEEVMRFISDPDNAHDWLELVKFANMGGLQPRPERITTLSHLGAVCFNDSKKLRVGALRRQLVLLLAEMEGLDPDDERRVLERAYIVENPFTSYAMFCAPVALTLKDGTVLDFPAKLFAKRMAVQLPLQTALEIESIEWQGGGDEIETVENAAPFADAVAHGKPCAYTAGYPSLAVKLVIGKIGSMGIHCIHAGDADLDGLRIAEEISRLICVDGVAASRIIECAPAGAGIKMTEAQQKRLADFIASHTDFAYIEELEKLAARGRWFEQESFNAILREEGEQT